MPVVNFMFSLRQYFGSIRHPSCELNNICALTAAESRATIGLAPFSSPNGCGCCLFSKAATCAVINSLLVVSPIKCGVSVCCLVL